MARVIIVDDHPDSADWLAVLLKCYGHDVWVAYSGAHALEILETFRPTAALLDLAMPEMHGFELAQRIRNLEGGNRIRLVAVTAWDEEADRQRTREAGFDDHLVKPVNVDRVLTLLSQPPTLQGEQAINSYRAGTGEVISPGFS